jgi:hypothetical protein
MHCFASFVTFVHVLYERILGRRAYRWTAASLAACRKIHISFIRYSTNVFAMSSANKCLYFFLSWALPVFDYAFVGRPVIITFIRKSRARDDSFSRLYMA